MALKIGTHSFPVESATLSGILFDKSWKKFDPTIHDGINYSLYLKCQPQQVGDQQWRPTFEFDRFAIDAVSWPDIENKVIKEVEGSAFTAFHGSVLAKTIAFGTRQGHRFSTTIEGDLGGDVGSSAFTYKGPVDFDGYLVNGTFRDTEESLARRLESFIQLLGLEPHESEVKEHIPRKKMRTKRFSPAARVPRN